MLTVISRKLIIRRNYKCIIRVLNNEKSRYSLLRQPLCCSAGDGIRQKSSVVLAKDDLLCQESQEPIASETTQEAEEDENSIISKLKSMAYSREARKPLSRKKPDRKYAVNHFRVGIKSFILACIHADMMEVAQQSFLHYRIRFSSRDKNSNPIDTSVYNLMLKGWAKKGNINQVYKVFFLMRKSHTIPDMNTYANLILAVLNTDPVDLQQLSSILEAMELDELELSKLFVDSSISSVDRELIRDKFSYLLPDLEFSEVKHTYEYPCNLLSNFKDAPRTNYTVCPKEYIGNLGPWCREQICDETRGIVLIPSVYDSPPEQPTDNLWDKYLKTWRGEISKALSRDIKVLRKSIKDNPSLNILPFLSVLSTDDYVNIILDTVVSYARFFKTYSPPVTYLYRDLGRRFADRYHAHLKNQIYPEWSFYYNEYMKYYQSPEKIGELRPRDFWHQVIVSNGGQYNPEFYDFKLTPSQISAVGKFLFEIIIKDIKIDPHSTSRKRKSMTVNAFFTVFGDSSRAFEEIRVHGAFRELFKRYASCYIPFETSLLPMKVPPSPWLSVDSGGYLLCQADFIRPVSADEDEYINVDNAKTQNITPIFDSLNALSMVTWKINQDVLDVALEVFRDGGNKTLDIPVHDSKMPTLQSQQAFAKKSEKYLYLQEKKRLKQDRQNMYSLWCDCLYKLSIANYFRDRVFWLPHNIDFRGRVYACPPHLNHLGNDLSRSLMLFAKGKPLGPKGLDWLKIHLVNLTGLKKKESIHARLLYCDEILEDVLDSADNPLGGRKWWMEQDEPWQILACAKEIAKAVRHPDPASLVSYFPVHQDGSCNGLQHYAALGRDLKGAISVNLCPDEKPNDVYSDVAELVEKERLDDALKGLKTAQLLENKIQRRVIKQTVMTYVYGVTVYGAKLQIHKQLKEFEDLPPSAIWSCSLYLTRKTFKSIATMFEATQNIQHWFTKCAKFISFNLCAPVEWQTPLGLPVIQPYFKRSHPNNFEEIMHKNYKPNVVKQRNAFPPNFIHSLDSSHMMLTALECERRGLNFVAIHDSYWTHPINIDEMNVVCREKFVALHSEEILKDFSDFMIEKYGPQVQSLIPEKETAREVMNLFKKVPAKGELDLNNVLSSVYFFS